MKLLGVAVGSMLGALLSLGATVLLVAQGPGELSLSPSDQARQEIPADMLALYQRAAADRCPGLPWSVLAAIGRAESDHGRNVAVSSAGARGPMQFMDATWQAYGVDADGDGAADPDDPRDAVYAAADDLCANGGAEPARLRDAVLSYNHATWYVDAVLADASRYAALVAAEPVAFTAASDLLANPHLVLTEVARADLAHGVVDPRVVALLAALSESHVIGVSVLETGHSLFVAGTTRVSNHVFGRAADIYMVDGEAVSPGSRAAAAAVAWLGTLTGPARPDEVGQPFADLPAAGFFSDAAHLDHIHVAYSAP